MRKTVTKLGLCLSCLASNAAPAQTMPMAPGGASTATQEDPATRQVFLGVTVNGRNVGDSFLFARKGSLFYATPADLNTWRIDQGAAPEVAIDGQTFVPLEFIPGLQAHFDAPTQTMRLDVRTQAFETTRKHAARARIEPTPATFTAFLNYDLSAEYRDRFMAASFLEAGISDNWGFIGSTATVNYARDRLRATRLDSYFLHDTPNRMTRLVVGDTITAPSGWLRQFRYGGVRIGTEFSLQPDFITFPTPILTGSSTLPSKVDVLVNNALQYRTEVGEGPFSIEGLPLVTGSGDVTLQVRDALGIERTITTSYYASPRLLRRGLSQWSVEAGAVRQAYGFRNFSYDQGFVSGAYKRGLAYWLTLGGRAAITDSTQAVGGEANVAVFPLGEVGAATAVSTGDAGTGLRYRLYASHIAPGWNVTLSFQHSSSTFQQPGLSSGVYETRREFQGAAGFALGQGCSLGMSFTDVKYVNGDKAQILSANYNLDIRALGYLNVYAFDSHGSGRNDFIAGFGLTIPFGARSSAYVQGDKRGLRGEVRQTPPTDHGWGYRLAATTGDTEQRQAEVSWRGQSGEYRLQAAWFNGTKAVRALASGGLVFAGGQVKPIREAGGAMAIVRVPGQANVRVFNENRPVARTDKDGVAIVTGLRAYESNKLSIAAADIPLDQPLTEDAMIVVPRARSAAVAVFDTHPESPATVILQMPDGMPVTSGMTIAISGSQAHLFAGYGGEVFIPDLKQDMQIEADTPEGPCRATLPGADGEVLPTLGPFRCHIEKETRQ